MGAAESKINQLRVRVTAEERELLEKLCLARGRGETISDLVREAIALLANPGSNGKTSSLSPDVQAKMEQLAVLLKREQQQVTAACVEGILDLIERKCEVPLIVMETLLHLKYRGKDEKSNLPWATEATNPSEPS